MLGPLQSAVAAVHQHQRRLVIGHVGVHRADDAEVVDVLLGRAREQLADLDAALARTSGTRTASPAPRRSCARCGGWGPAGSCRGTCASIGLGSKVSTCDGPPFMNRWTTCLALPGKCGGFGASGPSDALRWRRGRAGGGDPARRTVIGQDARQADQPEPHAAPAEQLAAVQGEGGIGVELWIVRHGRVPLSIKGAIPRRGGAGRPRRLARRVERHVGRLGVIDHIEPSRSFVVEPSSGPAASPASRRRRPRAAARGLWARG